MHFAWRSPALDPICDLDMMNRWPACCRGISRKESDAASPTTLHQCLPGVFKARSVHPTLQNRPDESRRAFLRREMRVEENVAVLTAVAVEGDTLAGHVSRCAGPLSVIRSFHSPRVLLPVHTPHYRLYLPKPTKAVWGNILVRGRRATRKPLIYLAVTTLIVVSQTGLVHG